MPGQVELHLTLRADAGGDAAARLRAARAGAGRGVGQGRVQHRRPVDGGSRRRVAARTRLDDLGRRIVYRRTADVAADRRAGQFPIRPWRRRRVQRRAKTELAGVPPSLIEAHGAVSEPVAVALADGIRERTGSSLGLGITGIAGPGGGTPQKPVGTVAIALTGSDVTARVRTFSFFGGRPQVKFQATQAALDMVRRALLFPGNRRPVVAQAAASSRVFSAPLGGLCAKLVVTSNRPRCDYSSE